MTVPIPFTYPTQTLGQTPEQPENLTHELSQQTLTYTKLTYTNVLEDLVEAEVNRQIKALPLEIRRFVRPIEVMTYALNRLQPLYACSEAGVKAQREKARALYGQEIAQVVTWGIRAVQKDPLRRFHPLKKAPAITPQELAALESIRSLLQDPSITKETLGERLHSSLEAKRIRGLTQKGSGYTAQPDPFLDNPYLTESPDPTASNTAPALSWKDYKNRRSLSERKNLHLQRSTTGAAGSLRLSG